MPQANNNNNENSERTASKTAMDIAHEDSVILSNRVTAIETSQKSIIHGLTKLESMLEALAEKHNSSRSFPLIGALGVSTAVAGVALTILSLVGQGYVRDMNRIEEQQKTIKFDISERGKWMGEVTSNLISLQEITKYNQDRAASVPILEERSTQISKQIKDMDTVLQREMRLLDQTQESNIASLDQRLQQEMRLLIEPRKVQTQKIEEQLQDLNRQIQSTQSNRFTREDWHKERTIFEERIIELSQRLSEIERRDWQELKDQIPSNKPITKLP